MSRASDAQTRIEMAVVGAGLIGRRHIDCILENERCTLAAIVDPAESARSLAREIETRHFESLDGLLAEQPVDGIILATPNNLHEQQGLACLAAGVPVLVEKPITNRVEEGLRLLEAERSSRARLLVGHHRAHSPIMRGAREAIRQGVLGRLVTVIGSAQFYKPDAYFAEAPWRSEAGGGPILINMIHEIHNLRMLCGEITRVQAFSSNEIRNLAVEDTVVMNFRFAEGALGTFVLSDTAASAKSWEQSSGENSSYAAYPGEDCYHIAGTAGSLDIPTMRLKIYRDEPSWWKPFELGRIDLPRTDPLTAQLEHFCDVILGNATPLVGIDDGLQNLRVTEAIVEAARTGGVVDVELA